MDELRAKNHFVPECYLKRWENEDRRICVYRNLVEHEKVPVWKNYSTAAVAYHKHLYTQIISGKESDDLERFLCDEFESPADHVIAKAVLDKRLSRDDWAILIRFLAAQDVRTPTRLFEHLKSGKENLANTLHGVLNELKEKLVSTTIHSFNESEEKNQHSFNFPLKLSTQHKAGEEFGLLKVESYVGRSTWIHAIKHLLANTSKVLHTHHWSIIKPAKGYTWFTSDNPVIKLNYENQDSYDFGGGWGRPKGNIIFPISPEHAMFVQIGDKPISRGTRLTIPQTLQFRKFIAENSYRMIFSNHNDNEIPRLKIRVVDKEIILKERNEMDKWHMENAELEREYLKSNRESKGSE